MLRRNSSAAVVQASTILEAKAIDACCHSVHLEEAECNYGNFSPSIKGLVSFVRSEIRQEVYLNYQTLVH